MKTRHGVGVFGLVVIACFFAACFAQGGRGGSFSTPPSGSTGSSQPLPSVSPPPPAPLNIKNVVPNTNAELSFDGEIVITGQGLSRASRFWIGGQEIPFTIVDDETLKIRTQDFSSNAGALDLRIQSPDGQESSMTEAFFFFVKSGWHPLRQLPNGELLAVASVNGTVYGSWESGVYRHDGGSWVGISHADGAAFQSCRGNLPPVYCPTCLTPEQTICPYAIAMRSLESRSELYALVKESECPDCATAGPNRLFVFRGGAWQAVSGFQGEPFAFTIVHSTLYVVTSQGLYGTSDGQTWDVYYHGIFLGNSASAPPIREKPFDVYEVGNDVYFLLGSANGLTVFPYHRLTHHMDEALQFGPGDSCGTGCIVSPPVADLAIDPSTGELFFATLPLDSVSIFQRGVVGFMDIHDLKTAPRIGNFSLAPWTLLAEHDAVSSLIFSPGGLLSVADDSAQKESPFEWNPTLYQMATGGMSPYILPADSVGLSILPSDIPERISFAEVSGGKFFTLLESRDCFLKTDSLPVPGVIQDAECLGDDPELKRRYVRFLFSSAEGKMRAALQNETLELDPISLNWNPVGPAVAYAERQDVQFSAVGDPGLIPGPLLCALPVPDLHLVFVCAPNGTYVRFNEGPWARLGSEPHVRSLAFDPASGLYGVSDARGVLSMPLK